MTLDSVMEFASGIDLDTDELKLHGIVFMENVEMKSKEIKYTEKYEIIITCENQEIQKNIYNELTQKGVICKLSTL